MASLYMFPVWLLLVAWLCPVGEYVPGIAIDLSYRVRICLYGNELLRNQISNDTLLTTFCFFIVVILFVIIVLLLSTITI